MQFQAFFDIGKMEIRVNLFPTPPDISDTLNKDNLAGEHTAWHIEGSF